MIESALARRTKVWIVASKFENVSEPMSMWKFDTHMIFPCIIFVPCLLKVFSMRVWMVTNILDLSVTFWKLSNKLTK